MSRPILVSACLLGLRSRYDGASKYSHQVRDFLKAKDLLPVPVCPEQLAGLPTPRPRTEFARGDGKAVIDGGGDVVTQDGSLVNEVFLRGAKETLEVARLTGCTEALLKERSPSCGVRWVHRRGEIISGQGVTAALLRLHGLTVFSEEELPGNS